MSVSVGSAREGLRNEPQGEALLTLRLCQGDWDTERPGEKDPAFNVLTVVYAFSLRQLRFLLPCS